MAQGPMQMGEGWGQGGGRWLPGGGLTGGIQRVSCDRVTGGQGRAAGEGEKGASGDARGTAWEAGKAKRGAGRGQDKEGGGQGDGWQGTQRGGAESKDAWGAGPMNDIHC